MGAMSGAADSPGGKGTQGADRTAHHPAGTARVQRVAGPLVELEQAGGAAMFDVVTLGQRGLPGEVVEIRADQVTVQAYEYTGGLAVGERATPLGRPMSAQLGPWLLGGVFDGLLRPLSEAPVWLAPATTAAPEITQDWAFTPAVAVGDEAAEGSVIGSVEVAAPVPYQVLVPPGSGGRVEHVAPAGRYRPDQTVVIAGGAAVTLGTEWPVRRARPFRARLDATEPLRTGQRALDLLFPIARGSTAAVPGGFGTGKTVLLQQIAKWAEADVIVYVGCGERGNEMAEIVADLFAMEDPRGGRLADRTVVLANTSNMPMMAREASIFTAVTVAEFFRDMGNDVVVIADSTSRWAEARREFASRTGALPAEEGYPADLASTIAAFYERAGAVTTLGGQPGSVTILGAVSPPGGDMTEPVTAYTQRFVRCLWTLDRDLAYARHYPAVSWSDSFSRDSPIIGRRHTEQDDPEWILRHDRVIALLAEADRLGALADLVGITALPPVERMTVLGGRLVRDGLLQQNALRPSDAASTDAKTAALADVLLSVVDEFRRAVETGTPPGDLEQLDLGGLVRTREDAGPDDLDLIRERGNTARERIAALSSRA